MVLLKVILFYNTNIIKKQLKDKKTHIGFVFNLDKHTQSGSHWVSLFIDIPAKIIYYFDSANPGSSNKNGTSPTNIPKEIEVLVDRILKEAPDFTFYSNHVEHQRSNTECGMYSLFFLITMLTGRIQKRNGNTKPISLESRLKLFTSRRIPDSLVEQYRKIYYNSPKTSIPRKTRKTR